MKTKLNKYIKTFHMVIVGLVVISGMSLLLVSSKDIAVQAQVSSPNEAVASLGGYAWSDNIGWISMSGSVYGVKLVKPETQISGNLLDGYGWSDNVGWVAFGKNQLGGCPTAPCEARYKEEKITGWARVCSGSADGKCGSGNRTDGWDGWIKLSSGNDPKYGLTVSPIKSNDVYNFSPDSYAWGSEVVGWVNFSKAYITGDVGNGGLNDCATPVPQANSYTLINSTANSLEASQPWVYVADGNLEGITCSWGCKPGSSGADVTADPVLMTCSCTGVNCNSVPSCSGSAPSGSVSVANANQVNQPWTKVANQSEADATPCSFFCPAGTTFDSAKNECLGDIIEEEGVKCKGAIPTGSVILVPDYITDPSGSAWQYVVNTYTNQTNTASKINNSTDLVANSTGIECPWTCKPVTSSGGVITRYTKVGNSCVKNTTTQQ